MQFWEANNKEHHKCKSTMIICRWHTLCSYLHCWCDIYFRHVCILARLLLSAWLCVCVSCLPVCMSECLWVCISAWLPGCAGGGSRGGLHWVVSVNPPKPKWKCFNTHELFLTKNFGGHKSLTNTLKKLCYLLKNDCDEKKKNIDGRESFPGFKCPVDSIFEEIKERFLERIQIYNCYFKFIFDIGLNYCKFLRAFHV